MLRITLLVLMLPLMVCACGASQSTQRSATPAEGPPPSARNSTTAEDYLELGDYLGSDPDRQLSARDAYLKALELTDDEKLRARAFVGLGEFFQRAQEYARAIAYYQQAITLDPASASAFMHLGVAVFARDRTDPKGQTEAKDLLTRAARLDPELGDPLAWHGLILSTQGHVAEAALYYERALELGLPRTVKVEVLRELGIAYQKSGRFEEAVDAFEQIRREFPQYDGTALRAEIEKTRRLIELRDEGKNIVEGEG